MAFDGIVIANLVKEFQDKLIEARIYKIAQTEEDELLLTIKAGREQYRLLMSASASLPLLYFTEKNKPSPMTAPNFCMLLRKHIQNGRITAVYQPGLERIVHFEIEHLNELGDLCKKTLIIELMGKHSNIIFCNEEGKIIDSIKHISSQTSSLREVLPGREYFIPETTHKVNPKEALEAVFQEQIVSKPMSVLKALYQSFTGFSPAVAQSICTQAGIDSDKSANCLTQTELTALYLEFCKVMQKIEEGNFQPVIYYKQEEPVEFSTVELGQFEEYSKKQYDTISEVLENYYAQKNAITRIRQKSSDLRRIVQTALERNYKKYDLQLKQLKDTEKREKYKVYGELLHTYGYQAETGSKSLEALNYYTNEMVTIPLDDTISPLENAKKYFEKYNKLKRTYEALSELTLEVKEEINHLESIQTALDIALLEEDLVEIKEELVESGYIRRKGGNKKVKITSKPFHYLSSDGYHIYVGKNNFQNEELTFKFATGNDWWFHAKGVPGSHVIVKSEGNEELPDRVFEEAGKLAAFYSKNRGNDKVEIDYIQKKHVKKPAGSKPGFVVYYTNYSLVIDSNISEIQLISG
ncbi:MAG: NFACT family protein [Lachnospiraceae bacterium]|nr:NFACT family protein [Lachnospiraceae bacterium]